MDSSDLVWIDSSIEERNKSVRKSKSKIDRFKQLVNQSDSKHLSSLVSMNAWINDRDYADESVHISADFSFMPENIPSGKKTKANVDQIKKAISTIKDKLWINDDQQSWLLLPKLNEIENYCIRPAVYDFIYFADDMKEPKLERFRKEFRLK